MSKDNKPAISKLDSVLFHMCLFFMIICMGIFVRFLLSGEIMWAFAALCGYGLNQYGHYLNWEMNYRDKK